MLMLKKRKKAMVGQIGTVYEIRLLGMGSLKRDSRKKVPASPATSAGRSGR